MLQGGLAKSETSRRRLPLAPPQTDAEKPWLLLLVAAADEEGQTVSLVSTVTMGHPEPIIM